MTGKATGRARLTSADVARLCGEMPDWKVARILASNASYDELEAAVAWSEGENDILGPARVPLSGQAAELYEILMADEDLWEEDR